MDKLNSVNLKYFKHWLLSSTVLLIALMIFNPVQARSLSPLPENLASITKFRGDIGQSYYFYVTGKTGSAYGTGVYTDDSNVATAAVHAGLLQIDQSGIVKVTVLAGQESYKGSTAHGISSRNYGRWSGSYSIAADDGGNNPVLPDPGNLTAYRAVPGGVYQFQVTGKTSGSLWGSNVYTDDSSLAKAAVHAGVLADGHSGVVRVVITPGQKVYVSNTANGIKSTAYNSVWKGGFTVANVQGTTAMHAYPGSIENPLADPGKLSSYRKYTHGAYYFQVKGSTSGGLWGTSYYTDDSQLDIAAVHSGFLKDGQTGVVKATIEPGQNSYLGSIANGVGSSNYGSYSGSYSLSRADGARGAIPVITSSLEQYVKPGEQFNYQIQASNSPTYYQASGLPEFLTVSETGFISGTASVSGRFHVELLVSNASGTSTKIMVLVVSTTGQSTGNNGTTGGTTGGTDNGNTVVDGQPEGCTATLDSSLTLQVPVIKYDVIFGGSIYLWITAEHAPSKSGITFKISNFGIISASEIDPACALATLSSDLTLKVPGIVYTHPFGQLSLSADFTLEVDASNNIYLKLTGYEIIQ